MEILAISDMHGKIDVLNRVPECDVLIIAGDSCPYANHNREYQENWLRGEFAEALTQIPAKRIIGIGGNHDYALQDYKLASKLPWTYLKDSGFVYQGIKFYGTPWVPNLPRWAFHASDRGMYHVYDAVPDDTDVVISHGPPFCVGDLSSEKFGNQRCGHPAVNTMLERVRPQVFVCGHIHESHGHYRMYLNNVDSYVPVVNVAYLDDSYQPKYDIQDISHYVRKVQA